VSGAVGFELWYLRDGGKSFFTSQTRGSLADPNLTRTELRSLDFPAVELSGPDVEDVLTLRLGHYLDLAAGPLAVSESTRDVARRLAAAITRSAP
jgi:hypothetical protein